MQNSSLTKTLTYFFWFTLLLRFFFPFFYNPIDNLFGDSLYHWESGKNLLNPTVIDGIDPKLYQIYLGFLYFISQENYYIIAFFTGVMCASMPFFWYKAVREISSKNTSIIAALLISLCPTLWFIYGFFMNETILLNMMAIAVWMTLRAVRKNDNISFIYAVIFLTLASLSRSIAIPFMVAGIGFLLYKSNERIKKSLCTVIILISLLVPAGMHTYKAINIFAPFGYHGLIEIYRKSGSLGLNCKTEKGNYLMMGNAIPGKQPLEPFYTYKSPRSLNLYSWNINTRNGKKDWEKVLKSIDYTFGDYILDTKENLLFFFFGYSWPETPVPSWKLRDSAKNPAVYPYVLEFYLHNYRWMWSIYTAIMFIGLFIVSNKIHRIFILGTLVYIAAVILQDTALITGRFRKPLEPFIIISVVFTLVRVCSKVTKLDFSMHLDQNRKQ